MIIDCLRLPKYELITAIVGTDIRSVALYTDAMSEYAVLLLQLPNELDTDWIMRPIYLSSGLTTSVVCVTDLRQTITAK